MPSFCQDELGNQELKNYGSYPWSSEEHFTKEAVEKIDEIIASQIEKDEKSQFILMPHFGPSTATTSMDKWYF